MGVDSANLTTILRLHYWREKWISPIIEDQKQQCMPYQGSLCSWHPVSGFSILVASLDCMSHDAGDAIGREQQKLDRSHHALLQYHGNFLMVTPLY